MTCTASCIARSAHFTIYLLTYGLNIVVVSEENNIAQKAKPHLLSRLSITVSRCTLHHYYVSYITSNAVLLRGMWRRSYAGVTVNGVLLFSRIAMIVSDQR